MKRSVLFILMIVFLGCGDVGKKKEETLSPGATDVSPATGEVVHSKGRARQAPEEKNIRGTTGGEGESGGVRDERKLDFVFIKPFRAADGRLLEYRIDLTYRTERFPASRLRLLEIVGKRGFLETASSSTSASHAGMNTGFYVRADEVYEALKELDDVGRLESENIRVTDHTEEWVNQGRRARREELRMARRSKVTGIAPAARNWREREEALERSEDSFDRAEQARWKIKDRTAWARVNVVLLGPELPPRVTVPEYKRALYGLFNLLLEFSYVLLWLIPLWLILLIVYLLRGRLGSIRTLLGSRRKG